MNHGPSDTTKLFMEIIEDAIIGVYEYSADDLYEEKRVRFVALLERIKKEKLDIRLVAREY